MAEPMAPDLAALSPILFARDARHRYIEELLTFFDAPVLVLTLNIPGPEKNLPWAEDLFRTGRNELLKRFARYNTEHIENRSTAAGSEWFCVIRTDARQLKRVCIEVENHHPLGRLFDIDVHDHEGVLSRREFGAYPRPCLLCHNDARVCSRMGAHSLEEILLRERKMVEDFLKTSSPPQRRGRPDRGGAPGPHRPPS